VTQVSEPIWRLFPELNEAQVIEVIRKFLRGEAKEFPPSVKKRNSGPCSAYDVAGEIITPLTRSCSGNVRDRHVIDYSCPIKAKKGRSALPLLIDR
jgi:hypothetical protein